MSEVKYKYIGNGGFVVGVPARDILDNEKEYHATVKLNIKNSSLPCWFEVEKQDKPEKATKADSQ